MSSAKREDNSSAGLLTDRLLRLAITRSIRTLRQLDRMIRR